MITPSSSANDSLFVTASSTAVDAPPLPVGFQCETTRDALLPTLTLMHGIAEKRNSLPILTHVYLEARAEGCLAMRATDLEVELQRACPADVEQPGACTADAQRLYDIMRSLPSGALRLTATSDALTITQDRRRFRLPSLDPTTFPQLTPVATPSHTIVLRRRAFLEMIERTIFAVSQTVTEPNVSGIRCEPGDDERLRLVATDGRRLAVVEQPMPGLSAGLRAFSLPQKGLAEMHSLLARTGEETLTLALTQSVATLTVPPTTLSVRVLDGDFPAYREILPIDLPLTVTSVRAELLGALRRLVVMTTDRTRGVTFALTPNHLRLTAQSPELGEGHEEVTVAYEGPALTIGFNVRYVLDFLQVLEPEAQIRLAINTPERPALFAVQGDASYQYVVMPMRLE
jgi:DNA polymerase III subunit beta